MNVATVRDKSVPISMVRRHNGMISVERRKLMTVCTHQGRQRMELAVGDAMRSGQSGVKGLCRFAALQPSYWDCKAVQKINATMNLSPVLSCEAHRRVILLDQSSNDAQSREPQILKGSCLGRSVQKRVQEQRDLGLQEQLSCLLM